MKLHKNSRAWININYSCLVNNIQNLDLSRSVVDLSFPALASIRQHIEQDLSRASLKGYIADRPELLNIKESSILKILGPLINKHDFGYAIEGILPILSSYSECLSLSNLAQTTNKRLAFMIHLRSVEEAFGAGDEGVYELLFNCRKLPMIDLSGFYTELDYDDIILKRLLRMLRSAESKYNLIISPNCALPNHDNCLSVCSVKLFGISDNQDSMLNSPLEIGYWAYPVKKYNKGILFRMDLGMKDGLPSHFPTQIAGMDADVKEVGISSSLVYLPRFFEGPFPAKGALTGGNKYEPVNIKDWNAQSLETILRLLKNVPVDLIR